MTEMVNVPVDDLETVLDELGAVMAQYEPNSITDSILVCRQALNTGGWKPISEAPKDGTSILLAESTPADEIDAFQAVGWWADGRWHLVGESFDDETCILHPTHFMPLHKLPQTGDCDI